MENPEEVLQALDEFQKMRPSEIPRELEEYLSWVAKTGDPVYQWSLVKPLFREKLTRVMTDFYESCPSLELAPCPNVEQFNYDIMKCNLLELLESFANAPFTVQRICELLTAPRKEYNRVDKFMRAIEKNILVVSTVEPGPTARRSENGDGMVNGSLDDETPSAQSTHDVEMESWVKDCTSENSVAIPAADADAQLLDSVLPTGKLNKIATNEEIPQIQTKNQEISERIEIPEPESSSQVITAESVMTDPSEAASRLESTSVDPAESTAAGDEVPTAVMNEDTNSQPSLDSEPEASESSSTPKLQTTFRTKDFVRKEDSAEQSYADIVKSANEKSKIETEELETKSMENSKEAVLKSTDNVKVSFESQEESEAETPEGQPEKRARIERLIDGLETENASITKDLSSDAVAEPEDATSFLVDAVTSHESTEKAMGASTTEATVTESGASAPETEKIGEVLEEKTEKTEEKPLEESLSEADRGNVPTENPRPIIEEPVSSEELSEERGDVSSGTREQQQESTVTIEEAMDDDTRTNKSIVPDPIPIIEEPKDPETPTQNEESSTIITELPEMVKNTTATESPESSEPIAPTVPVEQTSVIETIEELPEAEEDITDVKCPEGATIEEKIEPAESMEVDAEESLPGFQQDEPMEQESVDMLKS
ncbi:serine/threonine-protein phosphatase 4 regulatory subunit 2-like isoform X1 [Venturia canescens]|uniref:serine/threonine-protein phosphatase 4 regulatory subunit 2-like isoform X1 n=1 Tax=Venturia canescens TaxID=32260 RepID=UPI001C9C0084|nr:serine/threonine-protein phosphatase 4 regulatory subunit 2-like isoform X1 [Venturia canescens]